MNKKRKLLAIVPSPPISPKGKKIEQPSCSICLYEVKERATIDSCDHVHCYQCISTWAKQSNTCPACRKRFKKISHCNEEGIDITDDITRKDYQPPRATRFTLQNIIDHVIRKVDELKARKNAKKTAIYFYEKSLTYFINKQKETKLDLLKIKNTYENRIKALNRQIINLKTQINTERQNYNIESMERAQILLRQNILLVRDWSENIPSDDDDDDHDSKSTRCKKNHDHQSLNTHTHLCSEIGCNSSLQYKCGYCDKWLGNTTYYKHKKGSCKK